jgi:hypothetical protein
MRRASGWSALGRPGETFGHLGGAWALPLADCLPRPERAHLTPDSGVETGF